MVTFNQSDWNLFDETAFRSKGSSMYISIFCFTLSRGKVIFWSCFLLMTHQFKGKMLFSKWLGSYWLDCKVHKTIAWFSLFSILYIFRTYNQSWIKQALRNNYWIKKPQICLRTIFKALPESSHWPVDSVCNIT